MQFLTVFFGTHSPLGSRMAICDKPIGSPIMASFQGYCSILVLFRSNLFASCSFVV